MKYTLPSPTIAGGEDVRAAIDGIGHAYGVAPAMAAAIDPPHVAAALGGLAVVEEARSGTIVSAGACWAHEIAIRCTIIR